MSRDLRRHPRTRSPGTIRLGWQDASGSPRFARGRCLDVSASGIRVEVPEPIPLHSCVFVSAENINLSVNASILHISRVDGKYLIGMEFSCPLKALADRLARERQPEPVHRS